MHTISPEIVVTTCTQGINYDQAVFAIEDVIMAEVLRWYRLVLAHGYSSILCVSCNMITRIIIKKKELVFF